MVEFTETAALVRQMREAMVSRRSFDLESECAINRRLFALMDGAIAAADQWLAQQSAAYRTLTPQELADIGRNVGETIPPGQPTGRAADWLLCEHALSAADRLDVLEREHAEFFERWHASRRLNERLRPVLSAAVALVCAPSWAGISDEDAALEQALRDAGMVEPNANISRVR